MVTYIAAHTLFERCELTWVTRRRISTGPPELEKGCADMLAALGYTGVAMFEFRMSGEEGSPDSGWVLLEVNARPWGSMPLPVGLGVDFPYRWHALLMAVTAKGIDLRTHRSAHLSLAHLISRIAGIRERARKRGKSMGTARNQTYRVFALT